MGCNTSQENVPKQIGPEENHNHKEYAKPESAKTITLRPAESELEDAAKKIQAAFRGHQARANMKQPSKHEEKANQEEQELCDAATKIQASFRGHLTRKQMDKKPEDDHSDEAKNAHEEEELDIDLSDPQLTKAAIKIQASFRGHLVRKDHEDGPPQNAK